VSARRGLLHVARNTVRAGGRRALLVGGLIALTVALAIPANVGIRNIQDVAFGAIPLEQWGGTRPTGGADVRVTWWGSGQPVPWFHVHHPGHRDREPLSERTVEHAARVQRRQAPEVARIIADTVPPAATIATMVEGELPGQPVVVTTADPADPLVASMWERLDDGPAPTGDQVLMSDRAMRRFDGAVGGTVTVPGLGRAEVIGRVRDTGNWTRAVIVVAADREDAIVHDRQHVWLIGGLSPAEQAAVVADLSGKLPEFGGWADESERGAMTVPEGGNVMGPLGPPPPSGDALGLAWRPGTLGAGLLLIVIAIVASAAFTVDHRRRVRQAGMLRAVGASAAQTRRIAMWEAAVIGTAGAVAGTAAGGALAIAGQPVIERLVRRSIIGTGLDWVDLVAPAALGVAAALLAALRPARSAARVPLIDALRGRSTGSPSRPTLRSTVVVSVPVLLLVLLVAGLMSAGPQLGSIVAVGAATVAVGPLIMLLAAVAGRRGLLLRLALRSVARHRERTAVIVGALTVLAAVSITNFLALYAILGPGGAVRMWGVVLGGGCALGFLGATSALGAVETDADIRTVVAVGAPPAFRRWFQGAQVGVQVTIAMVLGAVTGVGLLLAEPGLFDLLLKEAQGLELLAVLLVLGLVICVPGPVAAVVVALLSRSAPARPPGRRVT
jgi:putative ABC transport system permease protein